MEGNELANEAAKEGICEPKVILVTSGGIIQGDSALRKRSRRRKREVDGLAPKDSYKLHHV